MEQPPVRLYVAGLFVAVVAVFTGSFSYGRAQGLRQEAASAVLGQSRGAVAAVGEAGGVDGGVDGLAGTGSGSGESSGKVGSGVAEADAGTAEAGAGSKPAAPVGKASGAAVAAGTNGAAGGAGAVAGGTSTTHTVRQGESLSLIARLYRVSVGSLRSANGLTSDVIKTGQRLTVPGAQPLRRHQVVEGDSFWELSSRYGVSLEELLAANSEVDPGHLEIGAELLIPAGGGGAGTAPAVAHTAEPAAAALAGRFAWPVLAPISSHFGPRGDRNHWGLDLAANTGDPIKAARDGVVLISGTVPGYGYTVVLEHTDGTRTLYGHASELKVKAGQKVRQGDVIALVGSTGRSTGPHLHFEIIVNDRPRDPLQYLPKR